MPATPSGSYRDGIALLWARAENAYLLADPRDPDTGDDSWQAGRRAGLVHALSIMGEGDEAEVHAALARRVDAPRPPSPFRVESAGVVHNGVLTLTAIRCDECGDLIEAEDREAGITDLDRDAHYTDCSKRKRP